MRNATIRSVSVGTSAELVAQPNIRRRVLTFVPHTATSYVVGVESGLTTTAGVNVIAGNEPMSFTYAEYGLLVQRGWYAVAGSAISATLIESYEVDASSDSHA